jgi:hypothetical protein
MQYGPLRRQLFEAPDEIEAAVLEHCALLREFQIVFARVLDKNDFEA